MERDDLFSIAERAAGNPNAPLAERMRPRKLDDVVGQDHLLADGSFLRRAIALPVLPSLILWGPPGTGKTTLGRLIAEAHGDVFLAVSAVLSGVKDLREAIEEAKRLARSGKRTVVFVDEIHRFNKAQQDALLPHVESGTITLIGATTENPSFEVNSALLSRSRVLQLKLLDEDALKAIVLRALTDDERGLKGAAGDIEEVALTVLVQLGGGDARRTLNSLEIAKATAQGRPITRADVEQAVQQRTAYHDASGDLHFDLASALIKSMRGSDPDAALYYLARMIEGGEDPLFIARRLVIFASEDVGNADPMGLLVANAVKDAVHFVGMPEARISLAQAVTYLASTHKSNASYTGINQALADVQRLPPYPIPLHIRNAPTQLMKDMGYHAGYVYPHDQPQSFVPDAVYLPEEIKGNTYYSPKEYGREGQFRERLERLRALRREPKK